MRTTDLYACKENATFDFGGTPVFLRRGDVVRAGHPIMTGREQLFEPLVIKYEWDPPRAADAPVRSVRAEHQGARSR